MIPVPTAPWAHYIGDAAAWIGAALATRWQLYDITSWICGEAPFENYDKAGFNGRT